MVCLGICLGSVRASRHHLRAADLVDKRVTTGLLHRAALTVTNVRTYDTMTSGTYGCQTCAERKKTGKPAELLPSGLLGPVTLQSAEVKERP